MDYDTAKLVGGPKDGETLAIPHDMDYIKVIKPAVPIVYSYDADKVEPIPTVTGLYIRREQGSFLFDWSGWKE